MNGMQDDIITEKPVRRPFTARKSSNIWKKTPAFKTAFKKKLEDD
jgi:hypothetical protein